MRRRVFALWLAVLWMVLVPASPASGQPSGWFTLERWATQQGDLIDGMLWFDGDFNGDGRGDLATLWNDAGQVSMDVHVSTGTAFALQRWATQLGGFVSGMQWLDGDFNGDGKQDLVAIWRDGVYTVLDVYASTGTAFTLQRWATREASFGAGWRWIVGDFTGDGRDDVGHMTRPFSRVYVGVYASTGSAFTWSSWLDTEAKQIDLTLWFVGDFNGDGRDDLAAWWDDYGQLSMNVHVSAGTSFTPQRWATKQGNVIGGMLWFDGDFNGDGKRDLATVWNDAGQITMDVQASTGTAFTLQRWATRQGSLIDGMLWFVGDFNGDGRDDVATRWNDGGLITMDVQASTGTAFTLQRWATQQGSLIDGMLWFVGDFNGDGKDDLAPRWNDVGKITIDVFVAHTEVTTPTPSPTVHVPKRVYLPIIRRVSH
jgi:serralysin